jgi:transposase
MDVVVERCAAVDIGKAEMTACVRTPGGRRQRCSVTRTFLTFTDDVAAMADWFKAEGVTLVVMEATGAYWKPVWYVLEDRGFELMLVNARHVKIVPGRKTDVADAEWLAQLLEHGLLRSSFVPPESIRHLRDLTRYRKRLVQTNTSEHQRIEKTLEDAGIKLDVVASDILGVSGRLMLRQLLACRDDPDQLAELAKGRLRVKIPELRRALKGRFNDHHRTLIQIALDHVEYLETSIERLDAEIDKVVMTNTSDAGIPFSRARDHLATIPGVAQRAAETIIAEIGVDMSQFPDANHLASWAGLCPGNNISGGKPRSGKTNHGSKWLAETLNMSVWAIAHTRDNYLAAQYWRLVRRIGKKKATVAVSHSILIICYHLLTNDTDYTDLGGDYFQRRANTDRHRDHLIRQLQDLGYNVTLRQVA